MKLDPEISKLIDYTITRIGQTATEANVLEALTKGKTTDVPRPPGQNLDVVRAFRKRNRKLRETVIQHAFQVRQQQTLPRVFDQAPASGAWSKTLTPQAPLSGASQQPTGIDQVPSVSLAEIARQSGLELSEVGGEVYVTLRCFETLLGKRPDHLRRTLEARGFPITEIPLPNATGSTRNTPAISLDYLFAIVALVDLHGLDNTERQRLFQMQRDLPRFMRRYEAAKHTIVAPAPKEDTRPLLTKGGITISVAALAATVGEKVANIVSDFANRLDIRLDRIERILATKTTRDSGPSVSGPKPYHNTLPNKFGICKPLLNADSLLERFDRDFGRQQRNLGVDSPEAIIRFAQELGIYRTQHWGILYSNDEWLFDASNEALSSYTFMREHLQKRILARNGASEK